jgi:hypothetical protein
MDPHKVSNEIHNMEYIQLDRSDRTSERRFGSSGVFRACCQEKSLHNGHTQWPPIGPLGTLPVIQLCHWVSSESHF